MNVRVCVVAVLRDRMAVAICVLRPAGIPTVRVHAPITGVQGLFAITGHQLQTVNALATAHPGSRTRPHHERNGAQQTSR